MEPYKPKFYIQLQVGPDEWQEGNVFTTNCNIELKDLKLDARDFTKRFAQPAIAHILNMYEDALKKPSESAYNPAHIRFPHE
jgi:hypothetical protein